MNHKLLSISAAVVLISVAVFAAVARQASPLLPPLSADANGRLAVGRGELVAADYAIAVAAAAQATNTDPALLFALAARARFASETYGADAATDSDAPVGGPYAYGSTRWLKDLARYGEAAGYSELAAAVWPAPSGTFKVDPAWRTRVMTARTDPYLSSFLTAMVWRQAHRELSVRRAPSEGLVMVAVLGGVRFAHEIADCHDKNAAALLKDVAPNDHAVLLLLTGLPARDERAQSAWTIGAFIDEITSRLRHDTSAYGVARRIDVPDGYRPGKPVM